MIRLYFLRLLIRLLEWVIKKAKSEGLAAVAKDAADLREEVKSERDKLS